MPVSINNSRASGGTGHELVRESEEGRGGGSHQKQLEASNCFAGSENRALALGGRCGNEVNLFVIGRSGRQHVPAIEF